MFPSTRPAIRQPGRSLAATLAFGVAVGSVAPAAPPRSHIAPVGEVAAAERDRQVTGLELAPAPEVLRDQLGLGEGTGLVVEAVSPGSRADRAGFRRHDVLVSVDEQLLVLPGQFAALVANAGPAAALVVDVRRGGRQVALSLGDSRAEVDPADEHPVDDHPATAAASPAPPAALPSAPGATPIARPAAGPLPGPVGAPRSVDFVPPPGARRIGPNAVLLEGRDYWLKVYRDSETCLMVRDARGWLVFNGPIATPRQRSLIPHRVRDRVVQLETMLDAVPSAPVLSGPLPGPAITPGTDSPAPAAVPAPPSSEKVVKTPAAPSAPTPGAVAERRPPEAAAPEEPVAEIGRLDVAPVEIR